MKIFFPAVTGSRWVIPLLIAVTAGSLYAQGNLQPPGPPAATMLTLDQLGAKSDQANAKLDQLNTKADSINASTEKRIPIDVTHTPGDGTHQFVISAAGSYYLTGNILATSDAIVISANNVTLDLNGFSIILSVGSSKTAIRVTGTHVVVRNGTIRDWGGASGVGINATGLTNTNSFERLSITGCGTGLECSQNCHVQHCLVDSSASTGIAPGNKSVVEDCIANNNTGGNISAGQQCLIRHCLATNSSLSGGIYAQDGSVIQDCVASANNSSGISGPGVLIANCTADLNGSYGIACGPNSRVLNNSLKFNGHVSGHSGIICSYDGNVVEGNSVIGAGPPAGITISNAGNIIIKNIVRACSPNYFIVSGNDIAPLSTAAAMTSPVGNISD